jgi:TPP-dependent indolepyruvate ferredoxin oxidoreductase alpha subunit
VNPTERIGETLGAAADHWYAVPGYPITGLSATIDADVPVNEKVALEYCLGHSLAGDRAGLVCKHVGLNACADPLVQATTRGLGAGVVIVVGDDVEAYRSENAQDSRYYGELAEVPVLEPGPETVLECIETAFRLSEEYSRIALIRITPALLQSEVCGDPLPRRPQACAGTRGDLTHRGSSQAARRGTRDLFAWSSGSSLNKPGSGEVGVGAAGKRSAIVTVYPPPAGIGPTVVKEFGRPFVREHRHLRPPPDEGDPETYRDRGRRTLLCRACPFRPVMRILKEKALPPICDTGCALLALAPPFSHGISGYGLGSSIGVAATSTRIALTGDYALLHSGINALIDVYYRDEPLLCIVLQNRCLAMTGRQPLHDVARFLSWADPRVVDAGDEAGIEAVLTPPERPTTVIIRGTCPEGARHESMEC